jgi:hypothetical protein
MLSCDSASSFVLSAVEGDEERSPSRSRHTGASPISFSISSRRELT